MDVPGLHLLDLPFTTPALVFALAMMIFLVAPPLVERLRVPGIIGVIVAGIVAGPHGRPAASTRCSRCWGRRRA